MGFLKKTKKVGGFFFNFRFSQWINYDQLKNNASYLVYLLKSLYKTKPLSGQGEYEEVVARLGLSEEELQFNAKCYLYLTFFYLLLALSLLTYSIYIGHNGNWMGSIMSMALTFYAVSLAFRHHFWRYQIMNKNLSLTVKDWWQSLFHFSKGKSH